MIDLKKLAEGKYKISLDESYEADQGGKEWYYRIACRYGHVYTHGENTLGAYVKGRYMVPKVRAIPGTKIHQNGDGEATFLFPPELLDQIAEVLGARKSRPKLSEEQRVACSERLAPFRFQKERTPPTA